VHAAFATTLAATVDFEIIPAAALVTLFAVPSLLLYAVLAAIPLHRPRLPEVAFLVSLMPFSLYLWYCSIYSREGKELAMLILGLYVLPALLALSVERALRCEN